MGDFTGSLKELKDGIRKFINEKDFKEKFGKSKNLNNETADYKFDYLTDGKDGIKAIKVKVESGSKEYQATCILNVAND